jgi:hypothetical protein
MHEAVIPNSIQRRRVLGAATHCDERVNHRLDVLMVDANQKIYVPGGARIRPIGERQSTGERVRHVERFERLDD